MFSEVFFAAYFFRYGMSITKIVDVYQAAHDRLLVRHLFYDVEKYSGFQYRFEHGMCLVCDYFQVIAACFLDYSQS